MENKKEICQAKILPVMNVLKVIGFVLAGLGLLVILLSYMPAGEEVDYFWDSMEVRRTEVYNYFGEVIKTIHSDGDVITWGFFDCISRFLGLCGLGVGVLFLIFRAISINRIGKCRLLLHDKGITGQTATRQLDLPMSKVDNILVKHGFWDALRGGKSLEVRSASGIIKFHCVYNADEFMQKTLAEIQKWEDLNSSTSTNTSTVSGNSIESIQKLKTLLDQGLITQEEYENKRKELLNKI